MSSTDNLHTATSGRLGIDNLALHRRVILSQVERGRTFWRRLTADSLACVYRK